MAVIQDGIRAGENGAISFGNYEAKEKIKVDDFACAGDVYKVRTHCEVTRLERNGKLLMETVPGAAIHNLLVSDTCIRFGATGKDATQVTMELESETDYKLTIDNESESNMKTNRSGKVTFSLELCGEETTVQIEKQ